MVPRLPLATPSSAIAFLPQTTRSPTASWRSSTWSRSPPSRPRAASSSWQAVLSRSTSARRAANTIDLLGRVVFGLLPGRPPVLQQGQGGGGLGVGGHHPVMGPVGSHRLLDQPRADQLQGLAFPGLLLAAVLDQLGGAQAEAEGAETAAGVDRGQLPVIANQHHLGLGLLGVLEQAGQLAAADHAGLIHHQHRAGVQLLPASVQVAQQPVAGGHLLEPLPLQAHGRDPGRGRRQQPVAVQLPGMAGDAQGEGLARPRPPTTTATPAPPWHTSRTIACWSVPAVGWAARARRTA